ncbi:MAG: hypothetical protein NTY38_06770 [Acidobacteria bacterium]|nr:hypothetical protein [Acidobacteriota bacterium]
MGSYREDFDNGPGGWLTWINNFEGAGRVEMTPGALVARLPCWVDYLHAPPGAGYLHILFFLHTAIHEPFPGRWLELGEGNRFISGGFPTDFTGASVSVRLRGEVDAKGARLLFHIQSRVDGKYVNFLLTGQPLEITPEWSEQTLHLRPDPAEWTCLGARHDREWLASGEIGPVLADVNRDIHFVLFPLDIVPATAVDGDPHRLKAGEEYPLDQSRLPQGWVELDWIEIAFREA